MNIKKIIYYILALLPVWVVIYFRAVEPAGGYGLGVAVIALFIFAPAVILGILFLILALRQPWSLQFTQTNKKIPTPAIVIVIVVVGFFALIYFLFLGG